MSGTGSYLRIWYTTFGCRWKPKCGLESRRWTRRCVRIGASEATNETAVPEGRQAEWNGARLQSKLKKGKGAEHQPLLPFLVRVRVAQPRKKE